jgi:hypothetical protein
MGTEENKQVVAVALNTKRSYIPRWSKRVWIIIGIVAIVLVASVIYLVVHHRHVVATKQHHATTIFTHDSNGDIVVPAPSNSQVDASQTTVKVSGSVTKISSSQLTMKADDGSTVSADITSSTSIQKAPYDADGNISDIHTGTKIVLIYSTASKQAATVVYQP